MLAIARKTPAKPRTKLKKTRGLKLPDGEVFFFMNWVLTLGAELPFLWQLSYGNDVEWLSVCAGGIYLNAAVSLYNWPRPRSSFYRRRTRPSQAFFFNITKM
jgi:hypothetical protein